MPAQFSLRRISIHALLAESDAPCAGGVGGSRDFYPRSPCGERQLVQRHISEVGGISIHALLAESDRESEPALSQSSAFLSTLSLRRATTQHFSALHDILISIHALLAESDAVRKRQIIPIIQISIHALLAESDQQVANTGATKSEFLSTLSLRRATPQYQIFFDTSGISIHALLAESDGSQPPCGHPTTDFYPRSPCGERLPTDFFLCFLVYFYPRSPCGERQYVYVWYTILVNFYPRSPCGERHDATLHCLRVMRISIHALLAESDFGLARLVARAGIFLSTLSLRRATPFFVRHILGVCISIHALLAESD